MATSSRPQRLAAIGIVSLAVLGGLTALVPLALAEDTAFEPEALADRIGSLTFDDFSDFPAPFGTPEGGNKLAFTSSDFPGMGEVQQVSIDFPDGDVRYVLEYRIFFTEAAAKIGIDPALKVWGDDSGDPEREDERQTIGPVAAPGLPDDAAMTCATKALTEPVTVKMINCGILAPDGQTLVLVKRAGREAPALQSRDAVIAEMQSLVAPLLRGLAILAEVEQAMIATNDPGLMPKGGRVYAPAWMAQKLMAVDLTGSEDITAPFGSPGKAVLMQPTANERELGLFGKVRIPMDRGFLESGVEFWVFETIEQAGGEQATILMMAPPEVFDKGGGGSITIKSYSGVVTRDEGSWSYSDMRCSWRADEPGVVAQQLHCMHHELDSQAAIVAYSYGTPFVDEAARDRVEDAAEDAVIAAHFALDAVMRELLEDPGPPPDTRVDAKLDPALIGTWETFVSNGQSWFRWTLEIAGDATYVFRSDGAFGHQGSFQAKKGKWQLNSKTNDWYDGGSYVMPDAQTFNIVGRLGPSSWHRVAQ